MARTKRITVFAVIFIFVIATLIIYFYNSSKSVNEITYRTDSDPISSRFPHLKNIKEVYWSTKIISGGFGPSSYWMRGYVFLDHSIITEFEQSYTWETVNLVPKLDFDFKGKPQEWSYSEDFNNYIKPSNYVGEFYLDTNSDSIYFEVEQ